LLGTKREKERREKEGNRAMQWNGRFVGLGERQGGQGTTRRLGSVEAVMANYLVLLLSFFLFFIFIFETKILFLMFVCSLRHNQSHHLVIPTLPYFLIIK